MKPEPQPTPEPQPKQDERDDRTSWRTEGRNAKRDAYLASRAAARNGNTKRKKRDLRTALEVLREFKGCESQDEWLGIPFAAWAKLEQFEEFLAHLVEHQPLAPDTVEYIAQAKRAAPPNGKDSP